MDTKQIGQRVNDAMLARQWTQSDLAERSGLRQAHISQIINAERRPRFELMIPLARALGVSLHWLAGMEPKEPGVLEPDEEELLKAYGALDEAHRKVVLNMVRGLGEKK